MLCSTLLCSPLMHKCTLISIPDDIPNPIFLYQLTYILELKGMYVYITHFGAVGKVEKSIAEKERECMANENRILLFP